MGIKDGLLGMAKAGGIGLATGAWEDRRQRKQQEKLQKIQLEGLKEMGKFNQGLALEMWDKTNYGAQRRHMQNAGLNPGLMYGMGGGGGATTQGAGSSGVSGATATQGATGMGMQLGMQQQMQTAQIEVLEAQAHKTRVEADKLAGVDTREAESRIANLMQQTQNAKATEALTKIQTDLADLDKQLKGATMDEQIGLIENAYKNSEEQLRIIANQADISDATKADMIKQVSLETTSKILSNTLLKTQDDKGRQEIQKIAADITNMSVKQAQDWMSLSQKDKEIAIKKKLEEYAGKETNFKYGTMAEIERGVNMATKVIDAQANVLKGLGSIVPL